MTEKIVFSWSGGKDSALALHELRSNGAYRVTALLTTVTADYDRSSMHGIRRSLLRRQTDAIGLPLIEVPITKDADNAQYEKRMRQTLEAQQAEGVGGVGIGDIFLEDLRRYREEKLAQIGMRAVFPIWKRDTTELARTFIDLGFRAIVTCVDTRALDASFAGREYDENFLADLPEKVDPCGENGEFHTFVHAGPIFSQPLFVRRGETVLRDERFRFCDVMEA